MACCVFAVWLYHRVVRLLVPRRLGSERLNDAVAWTPHRDELQEVGRWR